MQLRWSGLERPLPVRVGVLHATLGGGAVARGGEMAQLAEAHVAVAARAGAGAGARAEAQDTGGAAGAQKKNADSQKTLSDLCVCCCRSPVRSSREDAGGHGSSTSDDDWDREWRRAEQESRDQSGLSGGGLSRFGV
eukprot:COSAG04_NODE_593_length_12275_cov_8.681915_5_plen_137_part_00